jgi:hypothetical protein
MGWSRIAFGKHKGKTLPQLVFTDPDYFFWARGKGLFKGKTGYEAEQIYRKVCAIRIPKSETKNLVAEYACHPETGKFVGLEIVPRSQPLHYGTTPTLRDSVIDLTFPRQLAHYDKLGCRLLLSSLKFYLFGDSGYRMTKKRCEQFFENDANFCC